MRASSKPSKEFFPVLEWLRALAIILVPITHASYNEEFDINKIVLYLDVFAHFSVPIFLFISGFLSYKKSGKEILNRFPRIIIPYLILSIFCQVVKFRQDMGGNLLTIAYNLLTGDSYAIYYFVFVIVYLYIFAILVNKYVRNMKLLLIVILAISVPYFISQATNGSNIYDYSRELYYRFPLNWLMFFALGMYFKSLNGFDRLVSKKWIFVILFVISWIVQIVFGELGYWIRYGSVFWASSSILIILAYFTFFYDAKLPRVIKYLSKTSYTIYLLHIIPLTFISYFVFVSTSTIQTYSLPLTILLAVLSTLFSIGIREVCVKIFAKKSAYLIGS